MYEPSVRGVESAHDVTQSGDYACAVGRKTKLACVRRQVTPPHDVRYRRFERVLAIELDPWLSLRLRRRLLEHILGRRRHHGINRRETQQQGPSRARRDTR